MNLKQIKLAGFKSFVDPTVLELRSNLVGIVGPNGCGKSNVIDAVRFVLGGTARNIRGEGLSDVIFNGSNTRKPIGQASIELLFDNSDGSIGGEYAAYAEIAIRREVTRDGNSNYYLNGVSCRRRDIIDVFLGTGIGSRGYSIIEQGMIARIIESKPDDLRSFVEEAAGDIPVYKKRKHDTELRMHQTVKNLEVLDGLRNEQGKLLERLERQAAAAQKYQTLNAEKTLLEGQLLAVRWNTYDAKLNQCAEVIRARSVGLEEQLAARASIDLILEKLRIEREAKSDNHATVQSKYYELGSAIARVEQSLQHHKERKLQIETDVVQISQTIAEITAQKTTDDDELLACQEQLTAMLPEHAQACILAEQADEIYQDARMQLDACNAEWDEFQEQVQIPQQEAEICKAQIAQIDKLTRDLQARIDRLEQESATLDITGIASSVDDLNAQLVSLDAQDVEIKAVISKMQNAITQQRNALSQQQAELDQVRGVIQQCKGRQASLQALQQAALGKDDKPTQQWLTTRGLQNAPRLAQEIKVAAGWELAVETVLADYLEAVCVDNDLSTVAATIQELTVGKLTLFASHTAQQNSRQVVDPQTENLYSKVTTTLPLKEFLQNILLADSLATALGMRTQLASGQSIITAEGVWIGANWLRVVRDQNQQRGVLAREQELQTLQVELTQHIAQAEQLTASNDKINADLQEQEQLLTVQQQNLATNTLQLRDISSKYSAVQQKLEHMHNRKQRINIEREEHALQLNLQADESVMVRMRLEFAIENMATFTIKKAQIASLREQLSAKEKATKQQAKDLQAQMYDLEIIKQRLTTKSQGLQHTISRVLQQLAELHKREQQLQVSLYEDLSPTKQLQTELDALLAERMDVERALEQARIELESFDAQIKLQEQQRQELERIAQQIKDILDKVRLEQQTYAVRKETIDEQIQATGVDLKVVLTTLPAELDEAGIAETIDALQKRINNLGAINLAAMDELAAEAQRHAYLESQYTDLKEALTTLENAIKRIDRETRSKFQETFDQINANFAILFPKLFGGGKAYLELTGEDLLAAGVTVMAMPPGKKNATIHLLSGGEKALTAVALVFAIFQLNPAPFCMLDEVDAPLDESNVVRFGNLIKDMAKSVQFIVITHNKATMEIVNQLIGVTMKEPGVSRLVSVDIGEAVEMATA